MRPETYREVVTLGHKPWLSRPFLYWRCSNGHVSEKLPMP